ncbi:MAG: aminotransferase class V-fold PLP-dependent enzyme [Ruminococcaceae bacterium]|nr:aminotransferase class V-fold PLP-dependent enzyme [Oscillospiraceae bacterium]
MKAPIYDFIKRYAESDTERLHMPAHKGKSILGCEPYDLTEIKGADSLYEADGIIKESEQNASSLFGCPTFYSTEGSSLCIRAMLFLAKKRGVKKILAGANAHKTFVQACALLDIAVEWLYSENYLSLDINPTQLEKAIKESAPDALYITTPDYLGNLCDVKVIGEICEKYGILFLVDCAHGAYLKFLPNSLYPTDLGAHMCCSSAHKTLPCLTGGAYLHVKNEEWATQAKDALALFGSTSPSYLILASLDKANSFLNDGYKEILKGFIEKVENLKKKLRTNGYSLFEKEALKITICTKAYGYSGTEFGEILRGKGIEPEFCDNDFCVLMLNVGNDLLKIERALLSIKAKKPIILFPPTVKKRERVISAKEALFSESEEIDVKESLGRVVSEITIGCPPAVPLITCGEKIDETVIKCLTYYGIKKIKVIR